MKATLVDDTTLALGPFDYQIVSGMPEYYIARQAGVTHDNLIFVHKKTLNVERMIKSRKPMEII